MTENYVFSLPIAVRDYELDSEGIVNNAVYLHYFEHTRHAFCVERGFPFAQMAAEGIIPVVNRIEVDYRVPLRSGDVVDSKLRVDLRGVRFVFSQDLYLSGTDTLVAKAVVSVVAIENGRLSRGERFKPYLLQ